MASSLEARLPGRLNVKVHHLTLASKRGDSDKGVALILDLEDGTVTVSRAGGGFARRQRVLDAAVVLP